MMSESPETGTGAIFDILRKQFIELNAFLASHPREVAEAVLAIEEFPLAPDFYLSANPEAPTVISLQTS
jgi:hypothetical protein